MKKKMQEKSEQSNPCEFTLSSSQQQAYHTMMTKNMKKIDEEILSGMMTNTCLTGNENEAINTWKIAESQAPAHVFANKEIFDKYYDAIIKSWRMQNPRKRKVIPIKNGRNINMILENL